MPSPAPPDNKKNLILVADKRFDWRDFEEIAKEIVRQAPDIAVHLVCGYDTSDALPPEKWRRPTITVAFNDTGMFVPPRGRVFSNRPISKLDQHAAFRQAGIAAPRIEKFKLGKDYDEAEWGEFVVLKPLPLNLTSKGGNVQLIRTRKLAQISARYFPPDHALSKGPALVQQFIDTGLHTTNWRVLTLFGEPLYCFKSTCPIARPDLAASDAEIENAVIEPKHPRVKGEFDYGASRSFEIDEEIIAFARQVYQAFPNTPLQGCDVLRDVNTRKLYAIEINAGGNVWHFSSKSFREKRKMLGGKEVFVKQLDAWKTAARVLIAQTNAHAS